MFTGIVEAVGTLTQLDREHGNTRVHISSGKLDLSGAQLGESIAVSGVCLTMTELSIDGFWADVSAETLARTTFSTLVVDDKVNLERPLTPSTRLSGHLVSGHVDAVGAVLDRREAGQSLGLHIKAPSGLARYIAEKGSICVDGVSLTINLVDGSEFEVNIVPHTLQETTLGSLSRGRLVNLEVDIIGRYLERLLLGEGAADPSRAPLAEQ